MLLSATDNGNNQEHDNDKEDAAAVSSDVNVTLPDISADGKKMI